MKNKLRILLPLLVIVVGIALAAVIVTARPAVERQADAVPPPLVRAMVVELEEVPLDVASQGTVRPLTESTLVAQVAGQVTRVSPAFADGAFFRRGELLLQIDPRDFELRAAQADAQVARARVALDREEAEAELARQEWQELGRGEPNALTLREPQLAEARAALQAAEATLELARLDLSRTEIRAPFDGRVRQQKVDIGQFVGPGTPVADVFATDFAEVRLPVAERDLAFLDVNLGGTLPAGGGPEVSLRAAIGGKRAAWRGRVVRTGSQFDERTRMLELFARVDDPLARSDPGSTPLPMGVFVEATIAGKTAADVVVLPRSALRQPDRVLVVENERLRFREVEILRLYGDQAIVSGGLEPGERVCISALETVVDGMSVRVQAEDEPIRTDRDEEARL